MKVTIEGKKVEINRILITTKCSDEFSADFKNGERTVAEYTGYVPDFMPKECEGDYIWLDIDLNTGTILNWKRPSVKSIEESECTLV